MSWGTRESIYTCLDSWLNKSWEFNKVAIVISKEFWGHYSGVWSSPYTCQCRRPKRCGFDPWVGKIPWRRAQQPTPVFLPGESHGLQSIGLQRVRHDWSNWACTHMCMHAVSLGTWKHSQLISQGLQISNIKTDREHKERKLLSD